MVREFGTRLWRGAADRLAAVGRLLRVPGGLTEQWPQLLALVVFAVALWARADAMAGVFYDDGMYVVLAKALASGEGFRFVHLPDAQAGVHYPFLYPFVLSLLWRVWPAFPANLTLFHLFDAAALGAAVWGVAVHARRWAPRAAAYVVLPAAFIAFPLLTVVGVRLSEPLFLALAAWSLVLADREALGEREAVLAGILAGLATLTRTLGLALVVGIAVALWLRRRRLHAALVAGAGLIVSAPWFVWTAVHGGAVDPRLGPNYGTYLHAAAESGPAGLNVAVLAPLARLVLPAWPEWVWYPLAGLLVAGVMWGGVVAARRAPALVAVLLLYLAAIAAWPYQQDRFIWVLLPWLGLLCVTGSVSAWRWRAGARVPVLLLAAAVLVGYGRREYASLGGRGFAAAAEGIALRFRVLVPAVRAETPEDAVLAGEDEALLYLYTGRRAVPSYLFRLAGRGQVPLPADTVVAYLCEEGVTHLATTGGGTAAAPLIARLQNEEPPRLTAEFAIIDGPALYRLACSD